VESVAGAWCFAVLAYYLSFYSVDLCCEVSELYQCLRLSTVVLKSWSHSLQAYIQVAKIRGAYAKTISACMR
jgi:hypothetical protein